MCVELISGLFAAKLAKTVLESNKRGKKPHTQKENCPNSAAGATAIAATQ